MLDNHHPLHRSIVRLRDGTGEIFGAGFLVAPTLVCTCAHIVCDALGHLPRETVSKPTLEVSLDFPYLDGAKANAVVEVWIPMQHHDSGGDIAVLRLKSAPPPGAQSVRLLPVGNLSGREFAAFGFPSTFDIGQNAYGVLHDRLANGWVELQSTSTQGYRVQRGYSGTPVWDTHGRGVVGMVVADDSDIEAKVAFLIPNDLIQQACPDFKPITLSQMFKPLTNGLLGLPGSPLSGVEQFLLEYVGTLERPAPFGGRHKQLTDLDHWLTTPKQPYALLVAEAGRGKSALLAHWVMTMVDEQRTEVVLVPISIRFSTSLKNATVSLLGARLRHMHGVRSDPPRDAEGWLAEIELYLREDRPHDSPLLIVLDGADEAADWIMGQDLRFPPQPGRGIKVLVSARSLANCDAAGWMRRLEWQGSGKLIDLPLLDRSGVAEVLQAMGNPLATLATQVDVVGELYRLSEGDPLLVRLYIEALLGIGEQAAFLTPDMLKSLEPGLQGYFDQWWDDQHRQWGSLAPLKEPAVQNLLNLLACALGSLSTRDLQALMEAEQINHWLVEEALRTLARFIVGDGQVQGYVFSHSRLNQYFYEKLALWEHQKWQGRFITYGQQTLTALTSGELDPGKAPFYPLRYYGAHLEQADAHPEQFHELVNRGWLWAWEACEGTYDGFLSDLARAWKRADAESLQAQNTEERGRAIARQCRYALIVASINSLAGNIDPALLEVLVDKRIWTPIQGLAYARRIPNERQRVEVLVTLAPHLPAPLMSEVLAATQAIGNEWLQAALLADLAPYLSELLLPEALAAVRVIEDKENRARVLATLAPYLSVPLLAEALAAARAIEIEEYRAEALAALAPHLSAPLLAEALAAAREIRDVQQLIFALAALAPYLPEPLVSVMMARAQAIGNVADRTSVLATLAPHLPEPLMSEVLAAIQVIGDGWLQVMILATLAPHLSGLLLSEALAATRAIRDMQHRAEALTALFPHLSRVSAILKEDTSKARMSSRASLSQNHFLILRTSLFQMADSLLSAPLLIEALAAALAIKDEKYRARVLAALVPHLSDSLLSEALAATRAIKNQEHRAEALTAFVPHLSDSLLSEVLADARTFRAYSRARVLTALIPRLPAPLKGTVLAEALDAARVILNQEHQSEALTALIPRLPAPLQGTVLAEALAAARAILNQEHRAEALTALFPHLSAPLLSEALAATRAIRDGKYMASVLTALVPYLSAPFRVTVVIEALDVARAIGDEKYMASVLTALVPYLSAPLLSEALAAARAIGDDSSRIRVLTALIPHPSDPLQGRVLAEALAAARAIKNQEHRVEALTALIPYLSDPLQGTVLAEALAAARAVEGDSSRIGVLKELAPHLSDLLLSEALAAALATQTYYQQGAASDQAEALAAFVPYLSAPLLAEALAAARAIKDEEYRAKALTALSSHLSDPLRGTVLSEALAAARAVNVVFYLPAIGTQVRDEKSRAAALTALIPHLPDPLLSEALAAALAIEDEKYQARVLEALVPHLSDLLLTEALASARAIIGEEHRAKVLTALAPHLPEPLLIEALVAVQMIEGGDDRAKVLAAFVPHLRQLPIARLSSLWRETLRVLVARTRSDLLSDIQVLAPVIEALGGTGAVDATAQAIIEVGKWFP